jgi:DNA-binding MarR family transcriptional regulator
MKRVFSGREAFEQAAFLGGSPNRLELLEALRECGPTKRSDLVEATEMSRVTVKRILDDLEAQGWTVNERGTYRLTPAGEVVEEEFRRLLETLATIAPLTKVLPWLPADFDVDVRHLAGARVTVPTWSDSVAPVRRAADVCEGLQTLRVCASGVAPDVVRGIRDAAVVDGAQVEVVLTRDANAVVGRHPAMRGWVDDLVRAGGRLYEHPGHPYLLGVFDLTAGIGANDEQGIPRGFVESRDRAVVDWTMATIDRCRDEASLVDPEAFTV